ncbi:MAG: hypothetical protein DCC59_03355 [Chloroflexi bacterium]|nr:hypothetical protein [Chloroflexi bacterium CFX1]MCQ3952474.1 hypothetical protein [Chloroflexota bacterium]RIK54660.1 MAG: hypothetical protein DCC59_03355 [Chloroflexota bacterium]
MDTAEILLHNIPSGLCYFHDKGERALRLAPDFGLGSTSPGGFHPAAAGAQGGGRSARKVRR